MIHLQMVDLHKRYGDVAALDGCTFDVPQGAMFGFLGPNGAGKTTAMRSVFGLLELDAGEVRYQGRPITNDDRLRLGYMPEQRGLYAKMGILSQLVYFGRMHGMSKDDAASASMRWLETLGLADRAGDKLETLSHGNQQRIQLAAALVHDPDLMILDEPFSGLDPLGVQSMAEALMEQVTDRNATVIFSSHQLDLVEEICDQVAVVHEGRIVLDGSLDQLRADSPIRMIEVETADHETDWVPAEWSDRITRSNRGRVRLQFPVDGSVDPDTVLADIRRKTDVLAFAFEPPSLSELFLSTIGATSMALVEEASA